MKIKLGYACLTKTLDLPYKTLTYTQYQKEKNLNHLHQIISYNLENTLCILKYNQKNNIHFYRMSSGIVPLATHKEVSFDYLKNYQKKWEEIGAFIKENKMRVDFHPSEYAILNSTKKEVYENTIQILEYHENLLKMMKIEKPLLVLHIGSSVFGKEKSLKRFEKRFKNLPSSLQSMIALENDDRIFNVEDVLLLCEKLRIKMVLDYHHHICNPSLLPIENYMERILGTWKKEIPKIHFSSPKNKTKKDMRSHHDYIDADSFISFLEKIKNINKDIDIMIEAKEKDQALFKLSRTLKYKTNYKCIDETTFFL